MNKIRKAALMVAFLFTLGNAYAYDCHPINYTQAPKWLSSYGVNNKSSDYVYGYARDGVNKRSLGNVEHEVKKMALQDLTLNLRARIFSDSQSTQKYHNGRANEKFDVINQVKTGLEIRGVNKTDFYIDENTCIAYMRVGMLRENLNDAFTINKKITSKNAPKNTEYFALGLNTNGISMHMINVKNSSAISIYTGKDEGEYEYEYGDKVKYEDTDVDYTAIEYYYLDTPYIGYFIGYRNNETTVKPDDGNPDDGNPDDVEFNIFYAGIEKTKYLNDYIDFNMNFSIMGGDVKGGSAGFEFSSSINNTYVLSVGVKKTKYVYEAVDDVDVDDTLVFAGISVGF